jgi:hypothetical protein
MSTNISGDNPTYTKEQPITGPAEGGILAIGLQCVNMPTDGYISFSVPGPDAANTIVFPKTPILTPNYRPDFEVQWPPDFNSEITYSYYEGATPPPAGAGIEVVVNIITGS